MNTKLLEMKRDLHKLAIYLEVEAQDTDNSEYDTAYNDALNNVHRKLSKIISFDVEM